MLLKIIMPASTYFLLKSRILLSFFILPLVACPLWGQDWQKKYLSAEDYHLWSTMELHKPSSDGRWISYSLIYQNDLDTLFVRNSLNGKTFSFAKGKEGSFLKKNSYVSLADKKLFLLSLDTGNTMTIDNVTEYTVSSPTEKLIILQKTTNGENILLIKNFTGQTIKEILSVAQFSLSPKGGYLLYRTDNETNDSLILLNLRNSSNGVAVLEKEKISNFQPAWQKEDQTVSFVAGLDNRTEKTLYYFNIEDKKLKKFAPSSVSGFPENTMITSDIFRKLVVSDDSQRVFFALRKKKITAEKNKTADVEIWNANDKWIYPQQLKEGQSENAVNLGIWLPLENRFSVLTSEEYPKIMLAGEQEYAILSNPKDYEPQFDNEGPRDFYILNLKTFEKKIFLEKQSSDNSLLIPSPSGRYIVYFRDNSWWIYDIESQTHRNLTEKSGRKFTAVQRILSPEIPCGIAGWTQDDTEIIIYDEYDLWAFTTDGNNYRLLTNGHQLKKVFRLAKISSKKGVNYLYDGLNSEILDLSESNYLTALCNDGKSGFYKLDPGKAPFKLVFKDSYTDQFQSSTIDDTFFYTEQKFDLPPRLLVYNKKQIKTVFQSNPQHEKFYWGHSELVEFSNSKKELLKGVLIYPAHYDPAKKYPMIVYIYEKQSDKLHYYRNPSLLNENGFNASVYASEGYFVLLPDITLKKAQPGISALDCVSAAVAKIISMDIVKKDKIGIAGHSFGGYESSFIITQSPLFSAAVASGAITDLNSFYYTVGKQSGKPDMWRFKTEQWMMGKAPFEIPDVYDQNSPIRFADKIQTPVLLWTGKEDQIVDPKQSIEFYLALRRASKKSIMLLYPKENHLITDAKNQKDVAGRMLQWFNYFLKDDKSTDWITKGLQ